MKTKKFGYGAGKELAQGAVIGMIFGLVLYEKLAMGFAIDAVAGLVKGTVTASRPHYSLRHANDRINPYKGNHSPIAPNKQYFITSLYQVDPQSGPPLTI
jgi:hypothetical protein